MGIMHPTNKINVELAYPCQHPLVGAGEIESPMVGWPMRGVHRSSVGWHVSSTSCSL